MPAVRKRMGIISLLLCLLLCLPALAGAAGAAVAVENADFESVTDGMCAGWTIDCAQADTKYTNFRADTPGSDGGECLVIENYKANDARALQTLKVQPDTVYHFEAMVAPVNLKSDQGGPWIMAWGTEAGSPMIRDAQGWTAVDFYGKTGPEQTQMTLALRVGSEDSPVQGMGCFDEVKVTAVDAVPEAVVVQDISGSGGIGVVQAPVEKEETLFILKGYTQAVIFSGLFLLLMVLLCRELIRKRGQLSFAPFALLMVLAVALRLLLSTQIEGYASDLNCFRVWGNRMWNPGISAFYNGEVFADYPPGYMLILALFAPLRMLPGVTTGSGVEWMIIKLPAILADMAVAAVVFRFAKKHHQELAGAALALLVAFNPAVILDSAVWGQVDSVMLLPLLLSLIALTENKPVKGALWYTVALLIKPQTLMFGPLVLIAIVRAGREKGAKWTLSKLGLSIVGALALFFAVHLPFWGDQPPLWFLSKYFGTMGSYPYASLNAYNLFTLFGKNWASVQETFLGLSYQVWGTLLMALVVLYALIIGTAKDKGKGNPLFLCGAILAAGLFTFGVMMHERYLYPVIGMLLCAYVVHRDKRLMGLFGLYSVTAFMDVLYTLFNTTIPAFEPAMLLISAAHVAATIYLFYVAFDIAVRGHVRPFGEISPSAQAVRRGQFFQTDPEAKRFLTRCDGWMILGITAVYSVLALVNLGSLSAPEQRFAAKSAGDGAVIDLGADSPVGGFAYYGGIGKGTFTVETSTDGETYHQVAQVSYEDNMMFKWYEQDLNTSARYIRVTAYNAGLTLNEMTFYNAAGDQLPIAGVTELMDHAEAGYGAKHLVDEQELVPEQFSYLNSMYFDEIYHARTALEHIEHIEPYENTHPPLGKIMIQLGILIFGMNPFGWRIMGALMGILMVPAMYLLGKRLFKSSLFAALTCLLMTFDFMHFAQTRIATIDSYAVLLIILMYYFMYRYMCQDFFRQKLRRTLVPLGLSGLFFGLGVASKWICLYAGAGLAALFFITLYRRYVEHKAHPNQAAYAVYWRRTLTTCAWCVLFFIAVPAGIYLASYIPFMQVPGPGHGIKEVFSYQMHMYNYHSKLTATHPYQSAWWQWPVDARPIWFYVGTMANGYKGSISSFGNPLVWWGGLVGTVWSLYMLIRGRIEKAQDRTLLSFLLIGLGSQFLPWVLVTRCTFIYHYFASVPFIICLLVYMLRYYYLRDPKRGKVMLGVFAGAVILLFIVFYPAISGMPVPEGYLRFLEWFPSWNFI